MMTLKDLEILITIAEEKSYTAASRRIYMSQPAITQAVKRIERELDFSLLTRSTRGVELTPQGEILVSSARKILAEYRDAIFHASSLDNSKEDIEIGYVGLMNLSLFPVIFQSFSELFPDCTITLKKLHPGQCTQKLLDRKLRMVFLPKDLIEDTSELNFFDLYQDRFFCIVQNSNPLSKKKSISFNDFNHHTILIPSEITGLSRSYELIQHLEEASPECTIDTDVNSDNALSWLLSSDTFIVLLPGYAMPFHRNVSSIPLDSAIRIDVGIAYLDQMTPLEKKLANTARQVIKSKG